jgi:hypothetical protein
MAAPPISRFSCYAGRPPVPIDIGDRLNNRDTHVEQQHHLGGFPLATGSISIDSSLRPVM